VTARRKNLNSARITSTARTTSTVTITALRTGCCAAIQLRKTANASSPMLNAQLENGSGLVLAAARADALAPCDVSATLPASNAAPIFQTSGTAPNDDHAISAAAGGRMNVWTASQALSTSGILSAMNSMTKSVSAIPMMTGLERMCSEGGNCTTPNRSNNPAAATVA
jgi:hypothetical protein